MRSARRRKPRPSRPKLTEKQTSDRPPKSGTESRFILLPRRGLHRPRHRNRPQLPSPRHVRPLLRLPLRLLLRHRRRAADLPGEAVEHRTLARRTGLPGIPTVMNRQVTPVRGASFPEAIGGSPAEYGETVRFFDHGRGLPRQSFSSVTVRISRTPSSSCSASKRCSRPTRWVRVKVIVASTANPPETSSRRVRTSRVS